MYSWLWRHLPGPVAARIVESLVLVVGIAALLLFVVFPAVEPHLPFSNVTIDQQK